jgi:hypothetical protein
MAEDTTSAEGPFEGLLYEWLRLFATVVYLVILVLISLVGGA